YPRETGAITRQYVAGNIAEAQRKFMQLLPLCKAMFVETNPIPVKFAAAKKGLCHNSLRLPMTPLASSLENAVTSAMTVFESGVRG
ncbi:MAG: dihydrodipicolinate synthase family protein, partial [Spirochaetes bacterium]|nr:dihydrodipicolinate synthase family protein [Spirochaetota bacterium]